MISGPRCIGYFEVVLEKQDGPGTRSGINQGHARSCLMQESMPASAGLQNIRLGAHHRGI